MIGVEYQVVAYSFDKWVGLFGRRVDNFLEQKMEIKRKDVVVGYEPKYDFETAIAKAANDKRQRMKGFAELFAMLDQPGAPKKIIVTGK